ncbi:hypothetical protein [Natronorarus salvus]|uniref:hypothetical protein n=1 Tax=Natronorarus salvus TaxID=3117733 RepID=UPI002F26BB98
MKLPHACCAASAVLRLAFSPSPDQTVSDLLTQARERNDVLGSLAAVLASVARPDLTLLAIPTAFVGAVSIATVTGLSTHVMLAVASVVGFATILDAVVVNPPIDPG